MGKIIKSALLVGVIGVLAYLWKLAIVICILGAITILTIRLINKSRKKDEGWKTWN